MSIFNGDYTDHPSTAPTPAHHKYTTQSTHDWHQVAVRDERLATGGGTGGVSARIVAGAYDGNRCGTGATVGGGTTTGAMTGGDGATTGRAVGAVLVEAANGPVVTGPALSSRVGVVEGTAAATGDSDDGAAGAPVTAAMGEVSDGAAGSAGQSHKLRKAGARRNASSQNSAGI
jgi:hypothetical protein